MAERAKMEVEVGVQLEKASWRGGKMSYSGLNGVARNFPCQRTKFRVCQRYERKENSFLGPSPWRLQSVCQWKSVIQRSGYGKLSPKHNLHGLKSILSLLCWSCLGVRGWGMGDGQSFKTSCQSWGGDRCFFFFFLVSIFFTCP